MGRCSFSCSWPGRSTRRSPSSAEAGGRTAKARQRFISFVTARSRTASRIFCCRSSGATRKRDASSRRPISSWPSMRAQRWVCSSPSSASSRWCPISCCSCEASASSSPKYLDGVVSPAAAVLGGHRGPRRLRHRFRRLAAVGVDGRAQRRAHSGSRGRRRRVYLLRGTALRWIGPMFTAIEQAKPGFLTLPATGMSLSWFVSTVVLSSLGFYMWPHTFGSIYTARSEAVFRKNAVVFPLYQLVILCVFFAGFAALLIVPGGSPVRTRIYRAAARREAHLWPVDGRADRRRRTAHGARTRLDDSHHRGNHHGPQHLSCAGTARHGSGHLSSGAARWCLSSRSPPRLLALGGGQSIVALLLLGYTIVTQLFPALIVSLGRTPWASAAWRNRRHLRRRDHRGLSDDHGRVRRQACAIRTSDCQRPQRRLDRACRKHPGAHRGFDRTSASRARVGRRTTAVARVACDA